jgi:hypothetical protein
VNAEVVVFPAVVGLLMPVDDGHNGAQNNLSVVYVIKQ